MLVVARSKFLSSLYQHIHQEALTFVHSESQDKRRFGINSIRDFETLKMACECKSAKWFAPNLFNLRKFGRTKLNLQLIRVFALEFDVPTTVADLAETIEDAGLPEPHYIIQSKTDGHYHVYWLITPVKAFRNVVTHVDRITLAMAKATGADQQAIGAERWFGIPRRDIYEFADPSSPYSYEDFKDWYEINAEPVTASRQRNAGVFRMDVFGHPAIQKIMKGMVVGKRDNGCFTLALTYYATGWAQEDALNELLAWNERNDSPLTPYLVNKCVRSAFSGKYSGPSRKHVERLSGMEFRLNLIRTHEGQRKNQKSVDVEYAIVQLIRSNKNTLTLSQSKIAEAVGGALRTVKAVIKKLVEEQRIIQSGGKGGGRGNISTYSLANHKETTATGSAKSVRNNGAKSFTYISPPGFPQGAASSLGYEPLSDTS